ncbi:hypothetical protein GQ457_01G012930 [Hibiscus cannabinus]
MRNQWGIERNEPIGCLDLSNWHKESQNFNVMYRYNSDRVVGGKNRLKNKGLVEGGLKPEGVDKLVEAYIVRRLPKRFSGKYEFEALEMPLVRPFFLVPPSGSMAILVLKPSSDAIFILSVTSNVIPAAYVGRIHAIIFQSRYVISNASMKGLYYKQETHILHYLGVEQHSQLHWTDATSEQRLTTLKAAISKNHSS